MIPIVCPNCGGRVVGRLAAGQYYCWECFVEFWRTDEGWQVFQIDPEGALMTLRYPDSPPKPGAGKEEAR